MIGEIEKIKRHYIADPNEDLLYYMESLALRYGIEYLMDLYQDIGMTIEVDEDMEKTIEIAFRNEDLKPQYVIDYLNKYYGPIKFYGAVHKEPSLSPYPRFETEEDFRWGDFLESETRIGIASNDDINLTLLERQSIVEIPQMPGSTYETGDLDTIYIEYNEDPIDPIGFNILKLQEDQKS